MGRRWRGVGVLFRYYSPERRAVSNLPWPGLVERRNRPGRVETPGTFNVGILLAAVNSSQPGRWKGRDLFVLGIGPQFQARFLGGRVRTQCRADTELSQIGLPAFGFLPGDLQIDPAIRLGD